MSGTAPATVTSLCLPSRIQPLALSNAFFGSACREWQDHLALGLHGNTGGRGSRGEKKPRINDTAGRTSTLSPSGETGQSHCYPVIPVGVYVCVL